ncbi:peptidase family M49-domain-containing protein [Lasiosphaeris hirsuta]|uniref:Peptidase family M49-domain-containing protein n=1 Tax=Lasiosphaeris hirsuta TaxID=260670 RepID=A0AA40DKU1_9PEZI|nr:peptidase family M49-domain-containing protein [Lasiosphaeris hirsuta]
MRQTSPESEGIYGLVLHLHKACHGNWSRLLQRTDHEDLVGPSDVDAFLEYAAQFLAHLGNYYVVTTPPYTLGFPSKTAQSSYYIGDEPISREDVAMVTKVMEKHGIWPENTRVHKTMQEHKPVFEILQATSEISATFKIIRGDHAAELSKICEELQHAADCASNDTQTALMHEYIEYFRHGDVEAFRSAQKT